MNYAGFADGKGELDVPGATLGEMVNNLEATFPGITDHLLQDGRLKTGSCRCRRLRGHSSGFVATVGTRY